jgi:DNA-binding CsgD family transcriptional regulator
LGKRYLTANELARIIGISRSTVINLRKIKD